MKRTRSLHVLLAFVVLPLALASCGGDDGSGPETFSLSVTPGTAEIATGGSTTLTARVTDGSGATVSGQSFTWSSSNEAVATVSATGVVQALSVGQTTITATTDINGTPTTATATITVIQVAATVTVTPATGTLMVGETLQFTAEVLDGVGASIPGAAVTWSSSDPAVVTVDATGLATAVAEGSATISATAGTASGTATTEIEPARAPLEPQEDITLSGEVNVTTVSIPVGVTVTVEDDLMLNATGTVDISGTITGSCVEVNIQAVGVITLGGTLNTPCAGMADPPGVTLLSGSGFTLQDAVITTSGDVSLVSDVSADASPGFAAAAAALVAAPCFINSSRIEVANGEDGDDGQPDGEDGYDGGDITVTCGRDRAVLSGSTLMAGDGGTGGEGFSNDATKAANGGHGGHGGGVFLRSEVGISFTNSTSFLRAGSGGDGGPAEADSEDAVAFGGDGGHAGKILVEVADNGSEIFVEDLRFIDIAAGDGGMGGSASASGEIGDDATDTEAAKNGGNTSATGGTGGDNYPEENKSVLGDLIPRGLAGGLLDVDFTGGSSGTGGMALVQGGIGGNGNMMFPKGGDGGTVTAQGGPGGKLMVLRNGNEGTYPGTPGDGGMAHFLEAQGGAGFNDCVVGDIKPGGNGGKGGDASGGDGVAGQGFDGSNMGVSKGVLLSSVSNGGAGGDGVEPGNGGDPGSDGIVAIGTRDDDGSSFEEGPDGDPCNKPLDTAISIGSDPSGHETYIKLLNIGQLTLVQLPNGAVQITGPAPWVNLTGTMIFVAALDAWEINVSGDAAINPPPGATGHYNFNGTVTLDSDGRVIGFSGTVTVEASGLTESGPVTTTYTLTATMSSSSSPQFSLR